MRLELLEGCPSIVEPRHIVDSLLEEVVQEKREIIGVVCLNTKNKPVAHEVVSVGSLDGCVVHPREVFRLAVSVSAASILLVHNHPSGDLSPSVDDIEVTERLDKAGKVLGINLLDHVIVNSRREFFSFAAEGLLDSW